MSFCVFMSFIPGNIILGFSNLNNQYIVRDSVTMKIKRIRSFSILINIKFLIKSTSCFLVSLRRFDYSGPLVYCRTTSTRLLSTDLPHNHPSYSCRCTQTLSQFFIFNIILSTLRFHFHLSRKITERLFVIPEL